MSETSPPASATPATPARRFRMPDEIGVIVALVVLMIFIGVARPRFLNPMRDKIVSGQMRRIGTERNKIEQVAAGPAADLKNFLFVELTGAQPVPQQLS